MALLVNSTKCSKKNEYQSFSNSPKSRRGGNSFKLILQDQHYPDTKTRQGHKKRELQANIPDEQRCKNPQQNIGKPHPTKIIHHCQVGFNLRMKGG